MKKRSVVPKVREHIGTALFAFGGFLLVSGLIILIIGQFYLAFTDSEYAKHDDSLYALFKTIKYFWWAFFMVIGGFILICKGKWLNE